MPRTPCAPQRMRRVCRPTSRTYPQAGHGFINRITAASPMTPMLKVMGVGYDHAAAADAKNRILAFFDTHLREPLPTSEDRSAS